MPSRPSSTSTGAGSLGFAGPGLGPSDPDRAPKRSAHGGVSSFPPPPLLGLSPAPPRDPQHPPANWPTWPLPPRPAGRRPPDPQGPGDARRRPLARVSAALAEGCPRQPPQSPQPSRREAPALARADTPTRPAPTVCRASPSASAAGSPRRVRPGSPLHILTDHIHRVEIGPNLHFPKTR